MQGRVDGIPPKDCHDSLFCSCLGMSRPATREPETQTARWGNLQRANHVAQPVLHALLREQRVWAGTWRALSLRKQKKKDLQ